MHGSNVVPDSRLGMPASLGQIQSKLTQLEINSICSGDSSTHNNQSHPASSYPSNLYPLLTTSSQQFYQQPTLPPYFNHYSGGNLFSGYPH